MEKLDQIPVTQDKRARSMTMQEQARFSGLEFLDDSSSGPQWSTTREEYKPLLGGWRSRHASVVVDNDNEGQSIVVLGGEMKVSSMSDSVIICDSSTNEWRKGPSLNQERRFLAAVTCNGKVYAIGGSAGSNQQFQNLDTIESIDVESLLANTDSSNCRWKTLSCRLSTARSGCATVVVHDRYIVIMGGYHVRQSFSTVEVLDTLQNKVVLLSRLTMKSPRSLFGAAVVGSSIYAVGGMNNDQNYKQLDSVEVLTFNVDVDRFRDASTVFGKSSSWTTSKDLVLSMGRHGHAVAKIGNCVVVAGGWGIDGLMNSVEVLDPYRHVVWHLPNMTLNRENCSIAVVSKNIVVVGGQERASLEALALVGKQDAQGQGPVTQDKRARSMTMQEQARLSGLEFLDEFKSSGPQWNTTRQEYEPRLGGWRSGHSSVVVDHDNEVRTSFEALALAGKQDAQDQVPVTQDKRAQSMTMQEQAGLSGLEFLDDSSSGPQWSTTREEYKPLLGGWRYRHASVVVDNVNEGQSIVVLGGGTKDSFCTDFVIIWDSSTKEWRQGPSLNEKRIYLAAETCNGKVYAVGGENDNLDHLDTIECIDVASLLANTDSSNHHWKTLSCCLSTAKSGCAAVVVHDRYIVIMGGYHDSKGCFSTVEVLDTLQNEIVPLSGLPMNSSRSFFGAAVVGNSIYAVGGEGDDSKQLDSVEVLKFNVDVDRFRDASAVFGKSSSWTTSKDLVLSMGRHGHAVAKIGNCVLVAGGWGIGRMMNSVEVLDPYRHVVWRLPNMTLTRLYCSIAVVSKSIVVVGGQERASLEALALVGKHDPQGQGPVTQDKRARSMTMQEQARLSGLEFLDESSKKPQWIMTIEQYKPLLGGSRYGHASVVVDNVNEVQCIGVLGGQMKDSSITNSVIIWDSSTKQWRQGPCLNEKRRLLAAETCNGKVYAIGGGKGTFHYTDTIECIDVASLLANTDCSNPHWKTLSCRLSTAKRGVASVVVHDRYIVIMGGENHSKSLSAVEVLDTLQNKIVPLSGLTMNSPRSVFGAAVVGNSIYGVGGMNNDYKQLDSVEVLTFNDDVDRFRDASTVFGKSSSWTTSKDLVLSKGRHGHGVAKIGNCVVVAGGGGIDGLMNSVEVLDPYRHVVWHLPNMTLTRPYCSIAVLSKNIVVVGGQKRASLKALALVGKQDAQDQVPVTQDKRAPLMTMQEQARLSGLEFLDESSKKPQWIMTIEQYKPLLGGSRYGHASVVVDNVNEGQSIVVLGGQMKDSSTTSSVIIWDASKKQWRQGPCLNEKRRLLAAETCNGKVYSIGGGKGSSRYMDTIECIDVTSLLANTDSSNCHWKTLSCRLSMAKRGFATAVVHDRYIVIMGGENHSKSLSAVEVLDTLQNKIVLLSGLSMNSPRSIFGAAVVGNSIYAAGGMNNDYKQLDSVEVLTFNDDVDRFRDASTVFGKSSSWTTSKDLVLSKGRHGHGVAKIGNCVVVAGGGGIDGLMNSVEVLDPYRHVVWHLPNMTLTRPYCSIAVLSKNIVVVGGQKRASLEALALVGKQDAQMVAQAFQQQQC